MNSKFSRTVKALCVSAAVAMLSACGGSTSTVDPFTPTRVIGLGDGYNDVGSSANAPYTVRGTGAVSTVVEQVAVYFWGVVTSGTFATDATYAQGQLPATGLYSYAVGNSLIKSGADSLETQIARLKDDIGGNNLTPKDLIVITAGTQDIKATYTTAGAEAAADALVAQVKELMTMGAKRILILQPMELALTPYARDAANSANYPIAPNTSPTVKFNAKAAGDLHSYIVTLKLTTNPVIYGAYNLSSYFNSYANTTSTSLFANSYQPYCGNVNSFSGCAGATDGNYLFADGINLTPAGNRWVAQYLYSSALISAWR